MPRLNYMPQCDYLHRHRDRTRGLIGLVVSLALALAIWPVAKLFRNVPPGGSLGEIFCIAILGCVCAGFLALSILGLIQNGTWETRIEEGKIYFCTPRCTQTVDISVIERVTIGEASWTDSGFCTWKIRLKDGTTLPVNSRLWRQSLQSSLQEQNPRIEFVTASS